MSYAITESEAHPDPVDKAVDESGLQLEISLRRHLASVETIDDQQIDPDGIVHCKDCGNPIEPERIAALAPRTASGQPNLARSTAVRCIECQRAVERAR